MSNDKVPADFYDPASGENYYVPSVEFARGGYIYDRITLGVVTAEQAKDEFDRMINMVRAEAKAEALEETSYEIDQIDIDGDTALWIGPEQKYTLVSDWLRERSEWHRNHAAQLKESN